MAMNDRIILDEVLIQHQKEIESKAAESDFFEFFTAEQVLKDFDLSYDEIDSGLVGGSRDGGVDGIYLLVNGELVQEAPDYGHLKKNISLDLIMVQAKTGAGFQETPVERFLTFSEDILDLSRDVVVFKKAYNEQVVEAIERFRKVHQQLAARFPLLRVSYIYASKGGTAGETIKRKVDKLEAVLGRHFPSAEFNFNFWGASELLERARRVPQTTYSLTLAENPISSRGVKWDSFVSSGCATSSLSSRTSKALFVGISLRRTCATIKGEQKLTRKFRNPFKSRLPMTSGG